MPPDNEVAACRRQNGLCCQNDFTIIAAMVIMFLVHKILLRKLLRALAIQLDFLTAGQIIPIVNVSDGKKSPKPFALMIAKNALSDAINVMLYFMAYRTIELLRYDVRELFERRVSIGKFPGKIRRNISKSAWPVSAKTSLSGLIYQNDDRVIQVVRAPTSCGGWDATDENIIDRYPAEKERVAIAEQQKYRATVDEAITSFRGSVEGSAERSRTKRG